MICVANKEILKILRPDISQISPLNPIKIDEHRLFHPGTPGPAPRLRGVPRPRSGRRWP